MRNDIFYWITSGRSAEEKRYTNASLYCLLDKRYDANIIFDEKITLDNVKEAKEKIIKQIIEDLNYKFDESIKFWKELGFDCAV